MSKTKLLSSILLVLAVMVAQVGIVAAAPQTQDGTTTTITGTITNIETQTDENGETIVLVTVEGEAGTQTVSLSAQEAADNHLYDLATGELLAQKDDSVELVVDPNDVVTDEEPVAPDVHPISMLLAKFFFGGENDLGLTYEMASLIDSFHNGDYQLGESETLDQVFGFGVIAQALWMSKSFSDDGTANADLAGLILQAKKSGDYSQLSQYFEDGTVPSNWGQLKKALRDNKEKHNLGVIISGHADETSQDTVTPQDHGKNKDNGKGKGKDKQKNKNHP
jgi:hypothetical protein